MLIKEPKELEKIEESGQSWDTGLVDEKPKVQLSVEFKKIVWELSKENIGAGTGLYYLAASFAAIVGPITFGAMLDLTDNYALLWPYTLTFLSLAFLLMFRVISGELNDHKPLDALCDLD